MLQTLEGMFAKSSASERQAVITYLINTRMTGGRVKDHCLAMISHISRVEVMGEKLQKEMKIDLIFQSLPKYFNKFKVNYNMHKMDLTPVQLMHELESAEQSGAVVLFFENNRTLCLEDCLFAPDFKRNLVSVSCLVEHGLTVQFNSSISIRSKSLFICSGDLMNNLYFLSPLSYDINAIEIVENEQNHLAKKRKVSNETYLWHLLLGHINPNRIHSLVKSGILNSLAFEPIPMCESCLEGKMTKRPFKAKGYRATKSLKLVHTDVCRPMRVQSRGGYEYFVTFTDDYSIYGFVYLMRQKSETFDKFREYKAEAEKQLGVHIK